MANGTATDEENDAAPNDAQPMAAPAAPVAAPSPSPRTFVGPSPMDFATQQMRVQLKDTPLAEAERAIKAAQLFQAQRGYQRDIASGVSPASAFAKWGPSLFGPSAGSAAALSRVATSGASRIMRGPGGQLFRVGPTGQAEAISPSIGPRPVNPVTAVKQIPGNEAAIRKLEGVAPQVPGATTLPNDVFNAPFTPEGDVLRQRNFDIRQQIRPTVTPPRAGPAPQAPLAAAPTAAQAPRAAPQKVTTQAQFDALPSGTVYVGMNGRKYRKP